MTLIVEMMGRWQLLIALLVVFKVTAAQESTITPHLELMPVSIQKSLGENVYISCEAKVPNPSLVSEMRWHGPDGKDIPNHDRSIQVLDSGGAENKRELLIERLRLEHTGLYNCTAIYAGNQPLNADIHIRAYKGIDFQDTETVQNPIKGSDAKIKCHVSAEPPPVVDWLKDGVTLVADDRHIIQQDGVLIKNIDETDEGVYRCRARVSQLGDIDFRDIQVEVLVPPRITGPPKDMFGVEKESATFNCVATGKPSPSYAWTNPQNEKVFGKEGYFVDEIRGTLTIIQLAPHHSGTYRCTASNPAGDVTGEAVLTVHTKPRIEEHRNYTIALGKDVSMRCILSGEPLPVAVFRKEVRPDPFVNGVNPDNRIDITQETDNHGRRVGILTIHDLKRSDDGLYTCTGNSSGGTTVSWNHLTVQFPPTFEDQPQNEFWSWEQKAVNLTCLATSIPNATVEWYLHNEVIPPNNKNFQIISHGPNGILQVTPVGGTYFSDYRCKATNTLGTKEHLVSLSQVRKPGPVSSSKAERTTATTISWIVKEPVDDGGRPVVGFTVQYRPIDMSWDQAVVKYWPKGSESSYLVSQLTPQTEYVFRFAARNDVGDGEWSGEKSEKMPKRSAPEEPYVYSADSKAVTTIPYSDHYEIQWHVPLDNGESIDIFEIMYYKVRNVSDVWKPVGKKEKATVKYPGNSRYLLTKLNPDTLYKVELRAHNVLGFSTPGEIIFRTAYAPSEGNPSPEEEGSNVLVIIGILLLVLLLIILVIDVCCYFAKNIGMTAFFVLKVKGQETAKDKEAMLEDGLNSNKGEGNEKTEVGSDVKKVKEKESVKEVTEITETTPMIEGETDKEKIMKEEQHQQTVDVGDEKNETNKEPNVPETKDSSV